MMTSNVRVTAQSGQKPIQIIITERAIKTHLKLQSMPNSHPAKIKSNRKQQKK